jgi:hypothetical protein
VLLLVAYGGAFAAVAFGSGLPAYDDHPGQFFRLWHALERSFPAGHWTADWNPDWWGGYPELQFYPPGFVLAGAALRLLALWQLPVEVVYRLLAGLVLLLPGLSTYFLLARVLEDRWLALPPAFVALTLSATLGSGVEQSVRWGMLTSRLSLGLLPFLALALRPWLEHRRVPVWAPPAAAAVVLAHPANLPAVVVLLVLATLGALAAAPGWRTTVQGAAVAGLAALLTAFWTLPFLVRRSWMVPLAWGDSTLTALLAEVWARPLLVGAALAAPLAWVAVGLHRRLFGAFLAALPVVLAGMVVGDVALFSRGWSAIEPDRVHDALVLATVWAGGLGAGVLLARVIPATGAARPAVALAIIGLAALVEGEAARGPSREATLSLWPRAADWPTVAAVTDAGGLDRLWSVLRGKPDRVLFLTSSVRLDRDPAWYAPHTHLVSLAPLLAGREIVNGTFTHPSPVAARFYTGQAVPPERLDTLVERLDGKTLLGQPWESLTPQRFEIFARRLRVATVVLPAADVRRARFLDERYALAHELAGLAVFERRTGADPPWPRVERITHRRFRVLVSPAGGVRIPTGIPAYPLWEVKSARGPLPTQTDAWGLMEFRVPLDVFEAELVYREGWLEWLSLGLTLAGGAGWLRWAARSRTAPVRARAAGPSRSVSVRRRR